MNVSKTTVGGTGTFSFTATNLASAPASITTKTAGTAVAGAAVNVTTMGRAVTLTETPAAGYVLTGASCTDANAAVTGNEGSFGSLAGNVVTIPATNVKGGAAITCSLTSTRSTVNVSTTTVGGTGTFSFTATNLASAPANITTKTAGTAVAGAAVNVTTMGRAVTLTETPAAGYALTGASCTDANAAVTGNEGSFGSLAGNVVTIPAANVKAGAAITCSLTNAKTSTLQLNKTWSVKSIAGNASTVTTIGGANNATISSTATTAGNTSTGAPVTVHYGDTITLPAESFSVGSQSNYMTTVSCNNSIGTLSGATLPATFTVGNTDSVIVCAYTSQSLSPTITLQTALGGNGRVSDADQFSVAIRTGGVSGTVVNSTASSTTTGAVGTITAGTGTTGQYIATSGVAYTLSEAMAPSSASALSGYTSTITCTDGTGQQTGLPNGAVYTHSSGYTITPQPAVQLTCTITNAAGPSGISGKVFLDVGTGGGTPNDGVINGGEAGVNGIAVQLTNCAGTVYATAVTGGLGTYSFSAPSLSVGAALCVRKTNATGQVSTGASVNGTALPLGTATTVSGTSYTYENTGTPEQIAFTWNGTGHSGLSLGVVNNNSFTVGGLKNSLPNGTATYAHIFTAGTAGNVVFSVPSATATPAVSGWSERLFADPTCSGSLQSGATQLYPPMSTGQALTAGQSVCVVLLESVPGAAQIGNKNDASVQAVFTYSNANPTLSMSYTLHDVTTVDNVAMSLVKQVRNVTQGGSLGLNNQAKSGDVLEYQITYTNNAPSAIRDLVIADTIPAYTTFVSTLTGTTPGGLTSCVMNTPANPAPAPAVACSTAQTAGGTGAISWMFSGALTAGASGTVLFRVKVN